MKNQMLLVLALTILASCGGSKGGRSNPEVSPEIDPLRYSKVTSYQSNCMSETQEEETNYLSYKKAILKVREGDAGSISLAFHEISYASQNCETPIGELKTIAEGSFKEEGKLFEAHYVVGTLKPLTAEMTNIFNEMAACNINQWVLNKETDILKTECFGNIETGDVWFKDSFDVSQNSIVVKFCFSGEPPTDNCPTYKLSK